MIINDDALTALKALDNNSHNCCVTSPPYYNLRDYSAGDKEIGREQTVKEYITNLADIFDEVKRVLTEDGTCWINLGDSYAGSGKGANKKCNKKCKEVYVPKKKHCVNESLPAKSLMLVPQRLAVELSDRGWIIRNLIIWHKPNCMPSSVSDRFTIDYEIVIFCTKNKKYYFNQQFEPYKLCSLERLQRGVGSGQKYTHVPGQTPHGIHKFRENIKCSGNTEIQYNPLGRNMRTVWEIPTQSYKGGHYAVMSQKLAKRCLEAGCPVGGKVIDPFGGVFTTALVANELNMDYTMIELNPVFCAEGTLRLG